MSLRKSCFALAIAGVTGAALAGCSWVEEETGFGEKAQIGAAAGGTGGGLLAWGVGGGPAGIAAGVILGTLTGGAIGDLLDNDDKAERFKAEQMARDNAAAAAAETESQAPAPSTESTPSTPKVKETGSGDESDTYVTKEGRTCRDYEQSVTIDGKTETAVGTACLVDGAWKVTNS